MLEFVLASSNSHKAKEFAELFTNSLRIIPASSSLEVEETGMTYLENSLIKARAYSEKFKCPALADDSGLTIEALPDILGVQSARFLPDIPDYRFKCEEILKRLEEVPENKRQAFFTCVLCFYQSKDEVFFFEGRVHGIIGDSYIGEHGFGYDPIFVPTRTEMDGKTLAELPDWKNQNSHRAKAAIAALKFYATTSARNN